MRFEIFMPSNILKPYIKHFVISENPVSEAYKVLPNTSLVLGFQYKGRLSYLDHQNEHPLASSGITGIQSTYKIFKNTEPIGSILVFFKEMGASFFFKPPIHELFAESIALDLLVPKSLIAQQEELLQAANTDRQRLQVIELFLISQLKDKDTDPLVVAAVQYIEQSKGMIRISELAEKLNTSKSPLEKRFRNVIGASPKKYASIVRFRTILEEHQKYASFTELSYALGYFDQAHLIKDFKTFTGCTLEEYFYK
jgi:AraC-like DNA-binding protein